MSAQYHTGETVTFTIAWPPQTGIPGRIEPEIDELSIDRYPFTRHHQAIVAAQVHIDVARHAASQDGQPQSDNHARVAFEQAVLAKQCLHYAYLIIPSDEESAKDEITSLVAAADQLLVENQRPELPHYRDAEQQNAQDLELALAEAQAHHKALLDIKASIKAIPAEDLLEQEVAGVHMQDEHDDPSTPEDERNKGLIRMAAYLGDPPRGRAPEIRALTEYRALLNPLVEHANEVIFTHELTVKQNIGEHASRHGADIWGMTDELYGTEGIFFETHTCEQRCTNHRFPQHHNGHNIFMAYMHNGVRYIQAATEPFPSGLPRSRALSITEHMREFLEKTDPFEDFPQDERHYWRILHDLNGAIAVGVHDIDQLSISFTHEDLTKTSLPTEGLMQHILHAIALDNLHAVRFLAGAVIPSKYLTPNEQQVKAVIEAAQAAGMDTHQLAYLAESLYRDPATTGVIHTMPTPEVTDQIKENLKYLPEPNRQHLAARLRPL